MLLLINFIIAQFIPISKLTTGLGRPCVRRRQHMRVRRPLNYYNTF